MPSFLNGVMEPASLQGRCKYLVVSVFIVFVNLSSASAAEYAERTVRFDQPNDKYTVSKIDSDFGNHNLVSSGSSEEARLYIDGKKLRFEFPKGQIGSNSGTNLRVRIPMRTAYTFQYKMKWEAGYDWTRQSKMPGPSGDPGPQPGAGCRDGSCWAARFVAAQKSEGSSQAYLKSYVYHKDMPGKFGEHIGGNLFTLERDKWYTFKLYIKLNTGNNKDGILRGWVNGKQVLNRTNMRYVSQNSSRHIRFFRVSAFHGGSDDASRPDHTQYSWLDDVQWSEGDTPPLQGLSTVTNLRIIKVQ